MATPIREIEGPASRRAGCITIAVIAFIILAALRAFASYTIDFEWWKEMGQLRTWFSMLAYSVVPVVIAAVIGFLVLWISHARALKFAGTGLSMHRWYGRISTLAILLLAIFIASATTDTWVVVRYFGGRGIGGHAAAWHDPVYGQPLSFYLFELPFYSVLLRFVLTIIVVSAILYWATARIWQLSRSFPDFRRDPQNIRFDFRLPGGLESRFSRLLGATFLVALAVHFFLDRYEMLLNDHGFMVGMDYTNQYFSLPLQWVVIVASILAAIAVIGKQWKIGFIVVLALLVRAAVPPIVAAVYVRPNEISLEKPFIARHIEATRSAFGFDRKMTEIEVDAKPEQTIDVNANRPVLDNVRLWDWGAFRSTVSQIQPLRPYVYENPDVDRYTFNGELRQVLITARELDLTQLGDARTRWINPHFIYTHGYGVVMAEANHITANGLPVLLIKDAPPDYYRPRPEPHTTATLLQRAVARPGFCTHRAAGVRLSRRRAQCRYALRGQRRFSHLIFVDAHRRCRRARRLEHPAHQLPHARKPHDDPSQVDGAVERACEFHPVGHRPVHCPQQGRPLGLDRRWIHDLGRPSLFAHGRS